MIYTYRTAALPTEEFPPELYRIPTATPASTPAPTPAPTASPDPCAELLQQWARQNPQLARCINVQDASMMVAACRAAQSGRMTQAQATQTIQQTVAAACARSAPPATPPAPPATPPPSPPQQQAQQPTPSSGGAQPGSSSATPSGGSGGAGSPSSAPSTSPLRRWGPVVGVVILLGAGVYYVRKK